MEGGGVGVGDQRVSEVWVFLIRLGKLWQRSGLRGTSIDKLSPPLAALCALLPPVAA